MPSPTKFPLLPYWAISGEHSDDDIGPRYPVGASGAASPRNGGITTDLSSPLTILSELQPAASPLRQKVFQPVPRHRDGRPSALAKSFEMRRFPPVMLRDCALAS